VLTSLALCAARRRWLRRPLLAVQLLGWAALLGFRHLDHFWPAVVPWLNADADRLAWLLPTAWVIRPVQGFFHGGPIASFPLLVPAAALVWMARREMQSLIAQLRPRERVLLIYAAQLPDDLPDEVEAGFHREIDRPPDADEEEAARLLRSRSFLQPRPPSSDWVTGLAWHWWSPRQRLVAEWAQPKWARWTRRWLWGAGWMLFGFLSGCLSKQLSPDGWHFAWLLPTVVGLALLLPWCLAWQRWTQRGAIGSGATLWINLLPVSVSELVRMDRKLSAVRLLVAAPVVLLGGLGLAALAEIEAHQAMGGGLLIAILSTGLRPVLLAIDLSSQQPIKPFGVRCCDWLLLGMTLVAVGLAATSLIGVFASDALIWLTSVPAGLALLMCELVGRLSIHLWSRRRLNAVSFGQG
jgi:hypothetical protein